MAVRCERSGDVNQMHHASAEHITQQIGVVRQHDFDDFRSRRADGLSRWGRASQRSGRNRRFARGLLTVLAGLGHSLQSSVQSEKVSLEMCVLGAPPQARYNTRFQPMTQTQKPRREVLEQFVAEKPTDAFARYGLALECMKLGDNDAATTHFQKLLEANPKYVAGYFQFGQHLSRIGQLEQARKLLSEGILVAQNAGDMHARDEMQAALALLR